MSMYECDERNGRGLYMCFWPNWNASWVSYGCFGCTNSNFGRFEQYKPIVRIAIADTWFICAHNIQRRSEFIVCALMQSTHNDDNNKKHDAIKYGFSLFRMATHNFAWAFLLLCTIFMNSTCVLHVGWTFYRQMIRESISFNPIRGRWYSTWSKCAWKWFNSFHSESLFIPFHYFWMEKNANIADTKNHSLIHTHSCINLKRPPNTFACALRCFNI